MRARAAAHLLIGGLIAVAAVVQPGARLVAAVGVEALALLAPHIQPTGRSPQLRTLLCTDALVVLALWWLLGPVAGLGIVLFLVAALAGIVLEGRDAKLVAACAIAAEAAQIPLHFLAEGAGGLPLFHPPGQVVRPSEFLAGASIRLGALTITAVLFRRLGEAIRDYQQRVAESEAAFRSAFEDAPMGVGLVDRTGRIVRANRRLTAVLPPLDRADVLTVLDDGPADAVCALVRSVLDGATTTGSVDVEPVPGRFARVSASAIGNDSAERGHVVLHAEDVTAERDAALRLEELVRSKDEFVASISHELRTPLTAVVGFTQLLRDSSDLLDEDQTSQMIADIARESEEVSAIVEDLLVIARADIDRLAVVPEEVEVRQAVDQVVAALDTTVAVTVEGRPLAVSVDPVRFRQILRNLITNSARYGGPSVRVVIDTSDTTFSVRVMDDGEGIAESEAERVFVAYERAHENPTQPASVGLGLAVSRSLARAMGGDVTYAREEGWTVFEVRLPIGGPIAAAAQPEVRSVA